MKRNVFFGVVGLIFIGTIVGAVLKAKHEADLSHRMTNCRLIGLEAASEMLMDNVIHPQRGEVMASWRLVQYYEMTGRAGFSDRESWSSPMYQDINLAYNRALLCETPFGTMFAIRGEGSAFDYAIENAYQFSMQKGHYQSPHELLPGDALLLVEVCGSGCAWSEPGDIYLDNVQRPGIMLVHWPGSKPCPDGFCVTFADSAVWRLKSDTPADLVRNMATLEFARQNRREAVLGPYVLEKRSPLLSPSVAK